MLSNLLFGIAFEGASVACVLLAPPPWDMLGFLLTHGLASALLARLLWSALPAAQRGSAAAGKLCLFSILLLLPYFGAAGMYFGLILPLRRPLQKVADDWRRIPPPELPGKPFQKRTTVPYGEGALHGILRHSADAELKLKAVLATRHLDDKDAIPILRTALKDPVDDVRLTAYALLDRKEDVINQRIKTLLAMLNDPPPRDTEAEVTRIHRELGTQYWQLAYLGLAQGDVQQHILSTARQHAELALERDIRNPSHHFLLGSVLLRLGQAGEARARLSDARKLGLSEAQVLPYIAEAYFRERRFDEVRKTFSNLAPRLWKNRSVARAAPLWM